MAELISLAFYIAFAVSICIAAYIFYSNPKRWDVRLAFFVALFTAIRTLGYSMRSVATSFEEAYFWTYFAAVGWTTFYCLTFAWYYNYLFKKYNKYLNAFVFCVYLVFLWLFLLSPNAGDHYNLIISRSGIVDNNYFYGSSRSMSDLGVIVIYILSVVLILAVITVQFFHAKDKFKKRNLSILIAGILLSVSSSMVADQMGQLISGFPLPSLSPIFSLFTLFSILIVLIKDKKVNNPREVMAAYRSIGNIEVRIWERVEVYIGAVGIASFGLNRIFLSSNQNSQEYLMLISAILISFAMRMVRTYIENKQLSRYAMVFLLSLEIVMVMVAGYKTSLISIWFFPFCFLPLLVLLDSKISIYSICGISVLFSLLIIFNVGGRWVGFYTQGVIQRFTLGLIFIIHLIYANGFYRKRTSYNQRLIEIQEKFAEITAYYIDINIDNFSKRTAEMLRLCREFIQADRVFLLMFDFENDRVSEHVESLGDNIVTTKNFMRNIRLSELGWFMDRLKEDGIVSVHDTRQLPPEAKFESMFFSWSGINSIYCAPIYSGSNIIGVVGQEKVSADFLLPREVENFVVFAANTQAEAFAKIESQKKINHMAFYNMLTNLPNRFEFQKRIHAYIEENPDENCALAFLDLDSFQTINDIVGHDGGDELLVLISKEIARKIGKNDLLAHYAGDEFAIFLKNVGSKHEVGQKMNEVLNSVRVPKQILNREFFVTASIGVSIFNEDAHTLEDLISNSELAQYVAKSTGKNKYVICDEYMKIDHVHRIQLKKSLLNAIDRNELTLEFQPIMDAENLEIKGFEALIRLDTADYGRLFPGDFLRLADEVGMTVNILSYVIGECCRHIREWSEKGINTRITINLSCESIEHIDFCGIFREHIDRYGIAPESLVAEFSEGYGYLIDNETLKKLSEMGIRVSVDEFGSKSSSLSKIVSMCIDEIKIDIGFVQRIGNSPKDDGIAQSIIAMGKDLGLTVTALGVENKQQYEFFKNNGCDHVQGFFFYGPMSSADATDLLTFSARKVGLISD